MANISDWYKVNNIDTEFDFNKNSNERVFLKNRKYIPNDDIINSYNKEDANNKAIMAQFQYNEAQKRKLKPRMLNWVCWFILIQIIIMNAVLLLVILGSVVGDSSLWVIHSIDEATVPVIFEFLKYYVSATIVELLGMLYFMITKVFDNSILKFFELNQKTNQNRFDKSLETKSKLKKDDE